jgi:hypothetical protein
MAAGACGRGGSWEAKKDREKGTRIPIFPQGHSHNDLFSFTKPHLLKVATLPNITMGWRQKL